MFKGSMQLNCNPLVFTHSGDVSVCVMPGMYVPLHLELVGCCHEQIVNILPI